MTASAKSIRGSRQGVDYLIAEHKGYELDRNLIYGETSTEIMNSFRIQQSENYTCDKKFFTAYISPDPKDGQKLTDKELKEISHDFMKGIGVNPEKQAYLAIVHTEKNHKHVHLLINRIDEKNKAIKDNFIVLKAQNTVHKIAKERGLISARDMMHKNQENKIMQSKEIKKQIFESHSQVMKIKPQTFSKYMEYMKALGHEIKPTINRKGEIQGFTVNDKKSGQEFKMSEIKREMSANNLAKELKYDLDYKFNSVLDNSRKKQLETTKNKEKSQNLGISKN
ncbi:MULTISPECIES: relaxase/mobilization nuclease domain-containing protein [Chryseobacterium]|uniref:Relaxase/mobilization nuclease domain-containing protein n=1 Tax=Chryseobacterium gallinarum TaxID=1324352 RepID=A0ABX6KL92_CHRGL|nr:MULTISPECIES: relaxase/mobilization nuclease domain-containing protein [Chryseobacterium]MDG4655000.1 relaxase/mobilization nuclease domain-containing protein [Chryseobacterium arthrosphaerae]QIY89415.1 relaxase/mobilization nuclease domain-containing protein [Chryseobacterium gallinarum]